MSVSLTVEEFKIHLKDKPPGIVVDIDETLSATNVAWFERLQKLFGSPPSEDLTLPELIKKYSLAQNVPHWNSQKKALKWMQKQRDSKEAQKGLPLVPGAVQGVSKLNTDIVPVLGYLTVRPISVAEATLEWLQVNNFPKVPIVSKPNEIPFQKGNEWKGQVLNELIPVGVTGIVDDNPKVSINAGSSYPGTLFLFGQSSCIAGTEHAIPCETWNDVISQVSLRKGKLNNLSIK